MYNRLESLGIKPEKIGNRSFITAEEMSWMSVSDSVFLRL